jgi:hypothetical protein
MPVSATIDSIDWGATEKVVKVIQLRDNIPEETLAVLKRMLKGSELAPSLISLSVSICSSTALLLFKMKHIKQDMEDANTMSVSCSCCCCCRCCCC